MATDVAVRRWNSADVCMLWVKHSSEVFLALCSPLFRRAFESQQCFACQKVESVAKTTAFVSPAELKFRKVPRKIGNVSRARLAPNRLNLAGGMPAIVEVVEL
jgi:hypothetical protein